MSDRGRGHGDDFHYVDGPLASGQVRFALSRGGVGQALLDRPRALNSLTLALVEDLQAQLAVWRSTFSVRLVTLAGVGDRAFCAGGDVVTARAAIVAGDPEAAARFWSREYDLLELIATYPKPVVAVQHGYVMGGGLGLSAHARHRWATPDARFAMPETGIGFFPDAGISHLLARAPGETGAYLALTGATIDAPSARYAALTDLLLPAGALPTALTALAEGTDPGEVEATYGQPPTSELEADRTWIDPCFAGDDAAMIVGRLTTHSESRARACAALLRTRSPLSVAIALARVRAAAGEPDVRAALDHDRRIARALMHDGDFVEGVRARLVDKDEARWRHTNQKDVTPEEVTSFLE